MKKPSVLDRDTVFYQYDKTIGFWGIPSISRLVSYDGKQKAHYHVRHNSFGVRDDEYTDKLSKSVIMLGGSNTWGSAVEEEDRFSNLVRNSIQRPVLNFGHNSFGLDQIALTLMTKTEQFSPTVVIVEQYPWAMHRVLNHYVNGYLKPYFYLTNSGKIKLKKVPFHARFQIARNVAGSYRSYLKEFQEFRAGIDLNSEYDPLLDPIFLLWKASYYRYMYELSEKILVIMRDYCEQNNIRLFFLILPILQQFHSKSLSKLIDYSLPEKNLVKMLQKTAIAYVQVPELLKAHSKQSPVIQFDGHLNKRGHEIVARKITPCIRKLV